MKTSSPDQCRFSEECKALNMIAVPYFGVYSQNYIFALPVHILKFSSMPDNLPPELVNQIKELKYQYQFDPEYFTITLDGSGLYSKYNQNVILSDFLRVNMVCHPYLFSNTQAVDRDFSSVIFSAIYTRESRMKIINSLRECNEVDGLKLNPKGLLICKENQKEVILHPSNDNSPAISPNNCAFLMNTNNQIIYFYLIIVGIYNKQIIKIFVGQYNIFMNGGDVFSLSNSYKALSQNESNASWEKFIYSLSLCKSIYIEFIEAVFGYFCRLILKETDTGKLKDHVMNMFEAINLKKPTCGENIDDQGFGFQLTEEELIEKNKRETKHIAEFYYMELLSFIQLNLGNKPIDTFGELILFAKSEDNMYLIELLQKYLRNYTDYIESMFIIGYSATIKTASIPDKEIEGGLTELMSKVPLPIMEATDFYLSYTKQQNPYLPTFQLILEGIFNVRLFYFILFYLFSIFQAQKEAIAQGIDKLEFIYQQYLFYKVWESKGNVMGIHRDFGKLAFLNSSKIPMNYHLSEEEQCEILLDTISALETFDKL